MPVMYVHEGPLDALPSGFSDSPASHHAIPDGNLITLALLDSEPGTELNMASCYVNQNAQSNGDHEVHQSGCSFLSEAGNRIYHGDFASCSPAVRKAKEHYTQCNGCYCCARECHTS